MATQYNIKPCPFCGSYGNDIYVDEFLERYGQPYFVACNTCGACGPYTDRKEKAIELWNKRVKE
jgi:Lar family restriction alleviation protein